MKLFLLNYNYSIYFKINILIQHNINNTQVKLKKFLKREKVNKLIKVI